MRREVLRVPHDRRGGTVLDSPETMPASDFSLIRRELADSAKTLVGNLTVVPIEAVLGCFNCM
jgi:hypothetical protein